MDKKAAGYFLGIMVVLIGAVVLLGTTSKIFASTPDTEGENCRLLIGMKKTESSVLGDSLNAIKSNCQTNYIDLPGSQRVSHPDHLQKLFADKIERAWFIVHEGTVKDMWAEETFGNFGTTDSLNCAILYSITYEGRTRRDYKVPMEEFRYFLATNEAFEEEGVPWTYTQYIQSYGGTAHLALVPKDNSADSVNEFLRPGEVYAIAVGSATQSWWPGIFDALETTAYVAGGATIAFFAAPVAAVGAAGATVGVALGAGGGLSLDRSLDSYFYKPPESVDLGPDDNIVFFGDFDAIKKMGCEEITPGSLT